MIHFLPSLILPRFDPKYIMDFHKRFMQKFLIYDSIKQK